MGTRGISSALSRVRAAVKKISRLLNLRRTRWRVAWCLRQASSSRRPRCLSFNDRPGLIGCVVDDPESGMGSRRLVRASSCISGGDDVDKRADAFIANFHRQLRLERQISLELRYCRSEKSFGSNETSSSSS